MSIQLTGPNLTATGTSILFQVGSVYYDILGRLWQYVKGSATQAQYEYCKVSTDSNFTVSSLTTTTNPSTEPAEVGCLQMSGGLTSTKYGWVFRGNGLHTGLFAVSCAQDVKIYTTGVAGVVDDSSTTLVNGLKLITTITTAAASPAWAVGRLCTVVA